MVAFICVIIWIIVTPCIAVIAPENAGYASSDQPVFYDLFSGLLGPFFARSDASSCTICQQRRADLRCGPASEEKGILFGRIVPFGTGARKEDVDFDRKRNRVSARRSRVCQRVAGRACHLGASDALGRPRKGRSDLLCGFQYECAG